MTKAGERQQDHTLDAIAAVAHEGEKHFLYISLGVFLAVVVILGFLLIRHVNQLPELANLNVAVLLPKLNDGVAQDNAKRQKEGFDLAFDDNLTGSTSSKKEDPEAHFYYYNYPLNPFDVEESVGCGSDDPADLNGLKGVFQKIRCSSSDEKIEACHPEFIEGIAKKNDIKAMLQQVKCWYYRDRIRTFVITISEAVTKFKPVFAEWAEGLDPDDRPILLATVASAPKIANREAGIFRHYIRSEDESHTLAAYIESKFPHSEKVGIFYIEDTYGTQAMVDLTRRLVKSVDVSVYLVPINEGEPGTETKQKVEDFLKDKNQVAVVIGYGSMIKNTLNTLNATKKFKGTTLVVSTFTEESWRPVWTSDDDCFKDQIFYIEPITENEKSEPSQRGVVYHFSYLTLDRALKCNDERGVDNFWNCFINVSKDDMGFWGQLWNPNIEFTENGDSHISLRLVKLIDDEEISAACRSGGPAG